MGRISDEQLAELRKKNPRGVKVLEVTLEEPAQGAGGTQSTEGEGATEPAVDEYVFRVISRAEHTRYKAQNRRSLVTGGGGDEATMLARALLVWPTVAEFDELREKAPAITDDFGQMLLVDADAGLVVREGKR
jgi:hypothetical protein